MGQLFALFNPSSCAKIVLANFCIFAHTVLYIHNFCYMSRLSKLGQRRVKPCSIQGQYKGQYIVESNFALSGDNIRTVHRQVKLCSIQGQY